MIHDGTRADLHVWSHKLCLACLTVTNQLFRSIISCWVVCIFMQDAHNGLGPLPADDMFYIFNTTVTLWQVQSNKSGEDIWGWLQLISIMICLSGKLAWTNTAITVFMMRHHASCIQTAAGSLSRKDLCGCGRLTGVKLVTLTGKLAANGHLGPNRCDTDAD